MNKSSESHIYNSEIPLVTSFSLEVRASLDLKFLLNRGEFNFQKFTRNKLLYSNKMKFYRKTFFYP